MSIGMYVFVQKRRKHFFNLFCLILQNVLTFNCYYTKYFQNSIFQIIVFFQDFVLKKVPFSSLNGENPIKFQSWFSQFYFYQKL